ncbi:AsmA family protein [Falsiroseomonas sp. HW251]|uniref:AsmA family protein n=1 Tax=Falsiroseomonas sp. HW251 TaxID=3390998 RepID=UPI003D3201B7
MTASRRRRWPWILLAIVVALPLAAFVATRVLVNPDTIRPRLVAAVEGATGRRLSLGDVSLGLSLRPTLVLKDVALANAPGGSRPEMLTARRVEVQAALLPLLSGRIELARVELEAPDLLLETDAQGRGNWVFAPPEQQPAGAPSRPAAPRRPMELSLGALTVTEGRVTWRGARTETIGIPALQASAPLAGPTTLDARLVLANEEARVQATLGALSAFGRGPFPFDAVLRLGGGEARARGRLDGTDWTVQAEARLPDLMRLAPLLPDAPLPPLHDVSAAATLAGTGGEIRTAEAVALRVGATDLAALRPGLALARFEATAPRLDAPLTLAGQASLGGTGIELAGTLGTPAMLLGRAPGPLPVELRVAAAGAEATLNGAIRDLAAMAGVDLALALRVPDLAALSALAGAQLPAIRDIAAAARIAERTPGFEGGVLLRGLTLASPVAEAAGELTVVIGERPGLSGRLAVATLDLDAIRAAAASPAPAPSAAPPPAGAATPPGSTPAASGDGRVIPDLPIPVGALRSGDVDLDLSVAAMQAGGAGWRDIAAKVSLQAGQGRIAPFRLSGPGGRLEGELSADAAAATPALRLIARSPGLDLAALQRALGRPVMVSGQAELDLDLGGQGTGLRAVAGSLAGHLALAMEEATVEPALTGPVGQSLRERVPVLPPIPRRLPVDCVAFRGEAEGGVLRIGTLLADAPAAKVAGSGTVNLGTEAIALRLLHDVRAAGAVIRVAADLGGTLAAPSYRGIQAQNLGEAVGALGERLGGDVGALLGALGRGGNRPEPLPGCSAGLAAARGGRAGPAPAQPPAPAPPPTPQQQQQQQQRQPQINDLLRGLLRR